MLGALFKFVSGAAIGAAIGGAIGLLLAPQSGQGFKQSIVAFKDDVIAAGQEAEAERRRDLEQRFRQAKQFKPAMPKD